MKRRDRKLGMNCDITRRDFLNGVNIAVAGSLYWWFVRRVGLAPGALPVAAARP